MFNFFKSEIKYTDIMQDYRKIKIKGGFNAFDKILYRSNYGEKKNNHWNKAIVYNHFDYIHEDGKRRYGYGILKIGINEIIRDIIFTNPELPYSYEVKKDYGEFQEEFEALEKANKTQEEIDVLINCLEIKRKEAAEYYKKAKNIVEKNVINQFGNAENIGEKKE